MVKVLSVGGSIIVPNNPDVEFLSNFVLMVTEWLEEDKNRRLILVAGGGAPARVYQNAMYTRLLQTSAQTRDKKRRRYFRRRFLSYPLGY